MRNVIIALVAALAILFSPIQAHGANTKDTTTVFSIKGSHKMTRQSRSIDLSEVTKIVAECAVSVEIVDPSHDMIEIEINENLLEHFSLRVVDDCIKVSMCRKLDNINIEYTGSDIRVKIPYNKLYSSFEASAASSISSSVDIVAPEVWISAEAASRIDLVAVVERDCHVDVEAASRVDLIAKVGGVCNIEVEAASYADLTINAQELNASLDAFAKIEAQGRVERLNVDAEALTSFSGRSLRCESGKLSAEGMSKITYRGSGEFRHMCEDLSKIKNVAN